MMIVAIVFVLLVVVVPTWIYLRQSQLSDKCKPIPGPQELPFLGSAFSVNTTKMHLSFHIWAEEYGKIFQITLFGQKVIVLNDAALVRKAFLGEEQGDVFFNRPKTFVGKYILDDGSDLALAEHYGKQTVLLRKMVSKCLKLFSEGQNVFENHVDDEIGGLIKMIDSFEGMDFEMNTLIRSSYENMMYILMTGKAPLVNQSKIISDFNDNVLLLMETSMNLFLSTFPFLRFLPGLPGKLYRDCIHARDQIFERITEDLTSGKGLYSTLIEYQREQNLKKECDVIYDRNVKNIMLDVITAGTRSSEMLLASAFLVLLNNRKCLETVQAEVDKVIGRGRIPKLSDKAKMDYTMACLYETMRYTSIGPLGLPHVVSEDTMFEGYHISKGAVMFTNLWFMHRDPAIWTDPWEFKPDRFLDSNGKLQPPNSECRRNLLTFSVGKRSCPAGEFSVGKLFLYLTSVLQRFELLPPSNEELQNPDPRQFGPGVFVVTPSFRCRAVRRLNETTNST